MYLELIGVAMFRIFGGGGGGQGLEYLGGGANSQQEHDVVMTSMRRNDIASTSFRRHVPTRKLYLELIGVGRFRILGGSMFRRLGGGKGAHDVDAT